MLMSKDTKMMEERDMKFIAAVLNKSITLGASDIHISERKVTAMRVDGQLIIDTELGVWDSNKIWAFLSLVKLANAFKTSKSVDSSFTISGKRFRLHAYRGFHGIAIALRMIPLEIPDFDTLNLPEQVRNLTKQRSGLVLVTGPTGSGKSTTIASLLNLINNDDSDSSLIITVENPVEFIYTEKNARIVQREVGKNVDSFEIAVKDAMREDPDIILIGELQDREAIRNAITLAETGHLVFGSLHSNGAADTFDRIIDAFPGDQQNQVRSQLANRVAGIIHQILVPQPNGRGRVPMTELLLMEDEDIRRQVRNDSTVANLKTLMKNKTGMGLMNAERSVVELLKKGLIDIDTAVHYSGSDASTINRMVNQIR